MPSHFFSKCTRAGLLAALLCVITASAQADAITPFLTESGGTPRNDVFPQAGPGFSANPSGTEQINALGYWDQGGDGLAVAHDVAIYDFNGSGSTLVAKGTIPAGTAGYLENGYRWVNIPTITLTDTRQGGDYYQLIASEGPDTWFDGGVVVVNPSLGTFYGNGFYSATPMGGVGSTVSFGVAGAFGGPNMGFGTIPSVPEPSSVVLLALGAASVGACWIRRRKS